MYKEPDHQAVLNAFRSCGLRPEEIAVACDCNAASVYRWVRLGQLPLNRLVKSAFIRVLGLDRPAVVVPSQSVNGSVEVA